MTNKIASMKVTKRYGIFKNRHCLEVPWILLLSDTKILKDDIQDLFDANLARDPTDVHDGCSQLLRSQIENAVSILRG